MYLITNRSKFHEKTIIDNRFRFIGYRMPTGKDRQKAMDILLPQVPFTAVNVTPAPSSGQRLEAARKVTIPLLSANARRLGVMKTLSRQPIQGEKNIFHGFTFDDTDVYKTIEGASYILQTYRIRRWRHI